MATVLQVLPALDKGGVERGTVDLARYLVQEGHRAIVASEGGPLVRELESIGATHVTLPLATKNPLGIWLNGGRLARVIRRHGVDLVHARSRAPAYSARAAAQKTGVPFVTTFHAVYSGYQRKLKRRYSSILAEGDRVIAISDYVAQHLKEVYGVDPAKIRTIHRGVDVEQFAPDRVRGMRVQALAERFAIDTEHKVVMLPARVARTKGHLLLLRAVARMERQDFLVVFVGPDDPESGFSKQLHALVRSTGLLARVRFAGGCDDMPAALALADVVAVPSTNEEGFGRTSIEAQAMGRPVVVTDAGGLPETVIQASTGWVVPVDDPAELAKALDLALSMPPEALERLAQRARIWVTDNFTAQRMCMKTLLVYRELLAGRPGAF